MLTAFIGAVLVAAFLGLMLLELATHFARGVPVTFTKQPVEHQNQKQFKAVPGPPARQRVGHRFSFMPAKICGAFSLAAGGVAA